MRTRRFTKQAFWRINQNIRADRLRVIGPDGKQLGIFSLEEALKRAAETELDLVEIAPSANPPVAKVIDFTKFKYQQDKKAREQKLKERKGSEQKEIWLTPFMADNDYQVRLGRIKEFLDAGHKVRVIIKFTGRQMAHQEKGYVLTQRVSDDTGEMAKPEGRARFMGRQLILLLSPSRGHGNQNHTLQIKDHKLQI